MATLLAPDGQPLRTGVQVGCEFAAYLAQIQQDSVGAPHLYEFSAAIVKVACGYASGLLQRHDVPGLPHPNNNRESACRNLSPACSA